MSALVIRAAQPADAPAIADMLSRLADDLGDGAAFSSDSETIRRYGFGSSRMFHVVIAKNAAAFVGIALYFPHFSTTKGKAGVYVQDLWVAPVMRGAATGQKLLAAVAKHSATTWKAAYMKLSLHADNPRAKRFYMRLGFEAATNEIPMTADIDAFATLKEAL